MSQEQSDTAESAQHDWAWRRRIRANRISHLIYRIVVGIVGLMTVVLGLILVPGPGQGWLVVFLGLAVLASEFEWAQRLLQRVKAALTASSHWFRRQPVWMKGLSILATAAAAAAAFWLVFLISGVPGFFPDRIEEWLSRIPGLAP